MKLALGAVLAAATIAAAGQAAAQGTVTGPTAPAKSKGDPNRMVCKTTPVTGTRFAKSVCRTRAEWDDKAARDKQELLNEQSRGLLQRESG